MRSAAFLAVAAVVVLLLIVGGVGASAYDSSRENTVANGIAVGGVELGGLKRAEAERRLREELVAPLSKPVIVRSRGRRFTLTAQVAHLKADVGAMVDEALRRSRRGNVLTRTVRGLTGSEIDADLEPEVRFSERAVSNLVRRVARNVGRPARDASVKFTAAGVERVRARTGLKVRRQDLRERVEEALLSPYEDGRRVRAPLRRSKPKVTDRQVARKHRTLIHINRSGYTLRLYKNLKLVETYPIAVGQVGLETPAGLYSIQNKAINPAWSVPNSAWAGELAGRVIPGGVPENPLKARWLGIYDGVGVHGTDARGSIGTNASHGCIRMLVEDVVELYDRVPVGAPVYIA